MEGFECLPETAIPFKMKSPFKPHMVDAQLVKEDGAVVEADLPMHVDGKLGYIKLPDRLLPPGSYKVRLVKPVKGHPDEVLEVKFFDIVEQPETKKRKAESPLSQGECLPTQGANEHTPTLDLGDIADGEVPPNGDFRSLDELFEDVMEVIQSDNDGSPMTGPPLNSVESDGPARQALSSSRPPRIERKLREPSPEDEARTQPGYVCYAGKLVVNRKSISAE